MAVTTARADQEGLFGSIGERLGWMAPVAAWKFANDKPVEDLEREAVVLQAAQTKAEQIGLARGSVLDFFQAQIDAAKAIQWCWIARWKAGAPPPTETPDLVAEIRPALIRLGQDVLDELAGEIAQNGPITAEARDPFVAAVSLDCLDQKSLDNLFESLTEVRLHEWARRGYAAIPCPDEPDPQQSVKTCDETSLR
ncbi:MAG: gamma subclass chorismate mutase AroQ [Pseudomonadota bacterium]